MAYAMKKRAKKMASGGMMTDDCYQSECTEHCSSPCDIHIEASGYEDHAEGEAKHDDAAMEEDDMVSRIMKSRANMYSKGGKVANATPEVAGFKQNEFDDLVLRDDLESHYTSENSGDELGNEQEDYDRKDIVSRIMKSRAKKDRNPRPA